MGGFFQPIFFARSLETQPADTPGKQADSRILGQAQTTGRSRPGKPARATGAKHPATRVAARVAAAPSTAASSGWREAVVQTVAGLGYELVDAERAGRGLLRVFIDRLPGRAYAEPGDAVTVDDCEQVTRQLQYALEVDGVDYQRLEVSSPGLDRPLRSEADYRRFAGQPVSLTLKLPFQGRKAWKGVLGAGAAGGWTLVFDEGQGEQMLAFALDEVREAHLVPVLDFKGRRRVVDTAPAGPENGEMER